MHTVYIYLIHDYAGHVIKQNTMRQLHVLHTAVSENLLNVFVESIAICGSGDATKPFETHLQKRNAIIILGMSRSVCAKVLCDFGPSRLANCRLWFRTRKFLSTLALQIIG